MKKKIIITILCGLLALFLASCAGNPDLSAPGVTLKIDQSGQPQQVSNSVQLLVLFTVLSLAPSIMILMTSFTRIVIVLSLLRNAIGAPSVPPTQVLVGLALLLTIFIMSPVYMRIDSEAIQPYLNNKIDQTTALNNAMTPVREFMFRQTRQKDLELFLVMNKQPKPQNYNDISTVVLMPAFVISELRTAFTMGFVIYVPFLIIDMVISSVLLAMGMMMLPPSIISLPFKLLLFVMVDGWYLISQSLMLSFK
jgi:flagellar biosynthesis protein FliP